AVFHKAIIESFAVPDSVSRPISGKQWNNHHIHLYRISWHALRRFGDAPHAWFHLVEAFKKEMGKLSFVDSWDDQPYMWMLAADPVDDDPGVGLFLSLDCEIGVDLLNERDVHG